MEVRIDEEQIVKELKKHLNKRKQYVVGMIAGLAIFLIPVILVFALDKPILILLAALGGMVGFTVTFIAAIKYMQAGREYMLQYKQTIVKPIVQAMYPGAVYLPRQGITSQEYREMHLKVFEGTQYKSEDLIKGKCKGVAFRQADIEIVRASEKKHKIYEVDGQLREFEFIKPIEGVVLLGKHGRPLDVQPGMHRIEFENVDFNIKYDVYAEDEHSAFYVITPQFMEYLIRLHAYSDDIYMSFDGEKLRLLQSGRGGVFEAQGDLLNVSSHIANARKDLEQIEEVIDILHLGRE